MWRYSKFNEGDVVWLCASNKICKSKVKNVYRNIFTGKYTYELVGVMEMMNGKRKPVRVEEKNLSSTMEGLIAIMTSEILLCQDL